MVTPKLQHELKKKRPFESLLEEAGLNIVPHQRSDAAPLLSAAARIRAQLPHAV